MHKREMDFPSLFCYFDVFLVCFVIVQLHKQFVKYFCLLDDAHNNGVCHNVDCYKGQSTKQVHAKTFVKLRAVFEELNQANKPWFKVRLIL